MGSPLAVSSALPEQRSGEVGPWTILVVESDAASREILVADLSRSGQDVEAVETGQEALDRAREYDLVLLGMKLRDLDGLHVCRLLRATTDTPVIFIGSAASELDTVLALRAGGDDYLARPYGLRELMARIGAVMRRASSCGQAPPLLERGRLSIDVQKREVKYGGRSPRLTRKEFELLLLLARNPGKVISREEIVSAVWGSSWSQRTVDTHISNLRSKLGDRGLIVSVRGVGFMMAKA
ncbi:response regulator transcription factor [Streptomyces aquilus]|uniref:Response regulator transcription factor n=1 Tax=Streptomyces aquilus TaxID=2548456 RepID=A0A3Q9C278_9ACTN|nr:response regulator transcription factor [Streptomyces aquilus]